LQGSLADYAKAANDQTMVIVAEAEHYVSLGARYIASHAIRFMDRESKRFIQDLRRAEVPSPAVGTLPVGPL